jgi:delta 1-pyrroline-5-carboxylate dehydrogenase
MLNPYFIIAAMIAVGGAYGYGHHVGWGDRDAEMQIEIAKKNDEAREKERELAQQLNEQSTKLSEANNAITQKQSSLDSAIRAGRLRLPSTSCVQAPANAPTPTGDSPKERSEPNRPVYETTDSERATLQAIAEIVAQGDRNTAQLNSCISAYEKAMEIINGNK